MFSPGKNRECYEPGELSALPGLVLPTRQCARLRVADARLESGHQRDELIYGQSQRSGLSGHTGCCA